MQAILELLNSSNALFEELCSCSQKLVVQRAIFALTLLQQNQKSNFIGSDSHTFLFLPLSISYDIPDVFLYFSVPN